MAGNPRADRYSHTPRKVFDAYIDRMALKRSRDREDYRADLQLLTNQIKRQQLQLNELEDHVKSHCHVLRGEADQDDLEGPDTLEDSTEGL